MARKTGKGKKCAVESLFDLNASNVWTVNEHQIASLWKKESSREGFAIKEEKLLNTIRLAFEVVRYEEKDAHSKHLYESGGWTTFPLVGRKDTNVAIRVKQIKQLSDLNYENVKRITAATVVELIDRNFGCGWEMISPNIKEILESAFIITTLQLPESRMHAPGGTLERKAKEGYDILEIPRGTWTEAIFVKKKEEAEYEADEDIDNDEDLDSDEPEDTDYIIDDSDDSEESEENEDDEDPIIEEDFNEDESFFEDYIDEPELDENEEMDYGFMMDEE